MGEQIAWNDQAKAELRAIDQRTALRILHALHRFSATGEGDVKRLQGIHPPELRLRVGDYRLRFHDNDDAIRLQALNIGVTSTAKSLRSARSLPTGAIGDLCATL